VELLARVAERDRAAFEILYGRYVRPVFGLALRRLGDRGHAEDAVQEAFAAVWRSAATYRPERGAAGGWLYTVARNAIVDRLRRNGPAAGAELPELVSAEPGPSERAEESDTSFRVHRALEELQPREREVIELAYWSGMSQSEVAEYLGLPLGTVKTRTRSGLARLASMLEGELL
jgi:RNA polymerase sigma-70 factor, ECF subfamily